MALSVWGYHGTDREAAEEIIRTGKFNPSEWDGDWLGKGAYFWQDAPLRALAWPMHRRKDPVALGNCRVIRVKIDLSACFDLLDIRYWPLLKTIYQKEAMTAAIAKIPEEEQAGPRYSTADGRIICDPAYTALDYGKNTVDCMVINAAMRGLEELASKGAKPFSTVRAAFFDGQQIYKNSYFLDRNHVQIAVRKQVALSDLRIEDPDLMFREYEAFEKMATGTA